MAIKPGTKIGRHGLSQTNEHRNWRNMIDRCSNPKHQFYANYGGRGICVCDRWLGPSGFTNFIHDMGAKPTKHHSLERIDNDKGYGPDNCKWATRLEQSRNRRCSYTPDDDAIIRHAISKLYSYKQIAALLGKSHGSVVSRAGRLGVRLGIRRTKQPVMESII